MKLIADSGSTKTDWVLMDSARAIKKITTQGINPVHQSPEQIALTLNGELLPQVTDTCDDVQAMYFYGAGCTPERASELRSIIKELLPSLQKIEVYSDLLGAARAVCGHESGIACILGTGSNSCLYNGERIIASVPPLGYILGDEGSGAVLGRNLVNFLFKGNCPNDLLRAFEKEYYLTQTDILNKVYREPLPNRFLASLVTFVARHKSNGCMRQLVIDNFHAFVNHNLSRYPATKSVFAVGGIAYEFRHELRQVLEGRGYILRRILKSPIDGLVTYHASVEINHC